MRFGVLEALFDQVDVGLWRLDALFRLFLKCVKDIDSGFEANGVNRSIGIAIEGLHEF